jgi:hypothetical protein
MILDVVEDQFTGSYLYCPPKSLILQLAEKEVSPSKEKFSLTGTITTMEAWSAGLNPMQ